MSTTSPSSPPSAPMISKLDTLSSTLTTNRALIQDLLSRAQNLLSGKGPLPPTRPAITIPINQKARGKDGREADGHEKDKDARYAELQKENQILNQTIKQYETTLEILMVKFRQQAQQIHNSTISSHTQLRSILDTERSLNASLREENTRLQEQLDDCIRVMRESLNADDDDMQSVLAGVVEENRVLKQALATV
ncbi:hypothetical protein HDU85_005686 [Gaertneriomyces sp. JEL0708]|nr:hypothetical protein HDU85_005686 [Gaertneriomyces sp. JEL0708]